MENIGNRLKIDKVLEELYHLREENQDLRLENDFLQRKAALLKRDNLRITIERNQLIERKLLPAGPMTNSNIADVRLVENGVNTILGDDY